MGLVIKTRLVKQTYNIIKTKAEQMKTKILHIKTLKLILKRLRELERENSTSEFYLCWIADHLNATNTISSTQYNLFMTFLTIRAKNRETYNYQSYINICVQKLWDAYDFDRREKWLKKVIAELKANKELRKVEVEDE
jgi:hypothetical protein